MEWLFFDGIDMDCREKPVVRMDDMILNACARAACAEFSGFDETVSWADGASCAHGQLRLLGILGECIASFGSGTLAKQSAAMVDAI